MNDPISFKENLKVQKIEAQWPQTIDAQIWTDEFLKRFPNGTNDHGTLLGWFANAIMAGYNAAQKEH